VAADVMSLLSFVPSPLTATQKRIVLVLSIVIGLTRFLAIAQTLFDWDEALFASGVREYDVTQHHPHPPGYPLFILAAKVVHLFGVEEFRSLQVIVVLGAILLFPALFALVRELGFDFTTAICGSALFAFFPNVWLYGGTGFSDIPATTLAFAACALLLRGRGEARAYVAGAIVLGIAIGIRPTNVVLAAVPALLATYARLRARDWRAVAVAALFGGAIVGASYFGAARASASVDGYLAALAEQRRWLREVDSWRNPTRDPLPAVAKIFWVRPFWAEDALNVIGVAAAISLIAAAVRRRSAPWLTLAAFAPLAIAAWLNFDINTAARYSIGYMPVHALLAADGFRVLARRYGQIALSALVIGFFVFWTWPALTTQRTTDAPPVAALQWVARNVPKGERVWVDRVLTPMAEFLLPEHDVTIYGDSAEIPRNERDAWVVDRRVLPESHAFMRPHNSLWSVIRRRNFEASVSRASRLVAFVDGFYAEETERDAFFRWMRKEGRVQLPLLRGSAKLTIAMHVPVESLPAPPTLELYLNGALLDRFVASQKTLERSWTVQARGDAPDELRIVTSATYLPAKTERGSRDERELGVRIDGLTWTPVR
jgi:hypothetical protein